MNETGVYLIKNKVNNKIYVGSTASSFKKRFYDHTNSLNKNEHYNQFLQKSWNKYGSYNFEFIILEKCSKEDCLKREQYHLDTLIPEYNIAKIAGSVLGLKFISSEEVKTRQKERAKKLGLSHRGKKQPEHIANRLRTIAKKVPVVAKNLKTEEIYTFLSISEAARFCNLDKRHVSSICKKRFKSLKGWSFYYAEC